MKKKLLNVRCDIGVCLLLIFVTVIVYYQIGTFEFINYDTDRYVYENRHVESGLTSKSIGWAFTTLYASNWHPLTWLSHMLDAQLYGLDPGRHHQTSMLFHIANALLLFAILRRMTGDLWKSGFVAALFAIHPLHVQSVVWVAERKDVLSTFFGLLTIGSYYRYVQGPRIGKFMPIVLFFILGLMAKSMLVTLPFVLLLLDYWPLQRFQFKSIQEVDDALPQRSSNAFLIVEKIPLFIVSAASCFITLYAQKAGGAFGSFAVFSLPVRLSNALISYMSYIGKMIWPSKLAVIYPYPEMLPAWKIWAACFLFLGISFIAFKNYKLRPWFIVGWLWYLGTLVPVIGLVQVGTQAMADRYTYMPLIGLFIIIAWGLVDILGRWRYRKLGYVLLALFVIGFFSVFSWKQVGYWKNSIILFSRAIDVTDNNYVAHNNLGHRFLELGQIKKAVTNFNSALQINPRFEIAHLNLGLALSKQGQLNEAIKHYREALQLKPQYAVAHNNLGNAFYRLGKPDKAIGHYLQAIRSNPEYAGAYNNIGAALVRIGKFEKAVFFFKKALKINPDLTDAQNNLKNTLAALKTRQ